MVCPFQEAEAHASANMGKVQREMLLEAFNGLCKKYDTTELNKAQLKPMFPMVSAPVLGSYF